MSNKKDNRRVQYTKSALERSLLSLLKDNPIEKITVKELCERADINRGTFYSYYESPAQLLSVIEDNFYVNVLSSILTFQTPHDVEDIFAKGLTALKENADLSSVLFSEHADMKYLAKLIDIAKPICFQNWKKYSPDVSPELYEEIYSFVSYGCMNVIHRWIIGGMEESPKDLAKFLCTACDSCVIKFIDIDAAYHPPASSNAGKVSPDKVE